MAEYFRARTPDGVTQLSDERVFFSLGSSGNISSGWAQSEVNTVAFYDLTVFSVSPSDNPMLAVRSDNAPTWAYRLSVSGGNITYRVFLGAGSGTVRWWLFSTRRPNYPSGQAAMVLRDDSGQIVFSSASPIARVLGTYDQSGYTGLPTAGRTIAHVPLKMGKSGLTRYTNGNYGSCSIGGATPGYARYVQTGAAFMLLDLSSGSPVNQQFGYQTGNIPQGCFTNPPPQYTSSYSSLGQYSSLILDVTHY